MVSQHDRRQKEVILDIANLKGPTEIIIGKSLEIQRTV